LLSFFCESILILLMLGIHMNGLAVFDVGLHWDLIPAPLAPILIFILRCSDITLATLRMLIFVRGRPMLTWIIGFLQASLFISVVAGVLANIDNLLNIFAYAAGFATGNVIGITLESHFAPGHSLLRIISVRFGKLIAETLRKNGKGVTEVAGQGKQGIVSYLYCYVPRKEVFSTHDQIVSIDPEAFITVENVRQLHGGWKA
jgi:uncharacterized protein YebE (UPF0316 family)